MLTQFNFYGKSSVFTLLQRYFIVAFALGQGRINGFNPIADLVAPTVATHVRFKSVLISLDYDNRIASAKRSPEVYLPLTNTIAYLILQTDGLLPLYV